ncbi:hypothetical protein TcBrA4_0018310 [Trypanosoma cruzi]|nr:hypothetical protein TcBrA4_0018310 [Trypanosoma cruzi]
MVGKFAVESYEQLSAISRAAAVQSKTIWTNEMEQAESARRSSTPKHTHVSSPGDSPLRAELIQKVEKQNQDLRRGSTMLLEARAEKLGASSSPSWRYLRGVAAPHPHPLESVVLPN